jgi:Ig-like domain CHU_C associated/PKD domain/Secretion system C-terminal sorting domain
MLLFVSLRHNPLRMKHILLLFLSLAFIQFSSAQFTASTKVIVDDLQTYNQSSPHKLGKKAAGNKVSCDGDTLDYGLRKGNNFVGINISTGYRLGQFYEAPGSVTISGFDFYAWQTMGSAAVVEVYCQLYEAGADSLPAGSAIREDTLYIDSTQGTRLLTTLMKRAVFSSPYTTSKPYILVVTTNDTNRVAVVTNDYTIGDGRGEDLGCGSIGGRWYKFNALNIGGTPLDCDVLLAPHVDYDIFNDFSIKDCYDYRDTIRFTNKSSPFMASQVYNFYTFNNIERFSHRWDYYGNGSTQYMVEGQVKYPFGQNNKIRLISQQYHFRGGGTCIDTAYKDLSFQPDEIVFSGDKNICSGQNAVVNAISNSSIEWYRSPADTTSFNTGSLYATSTPLEENDTLYAKAINRQCSSNLGRYVIEVTTTPEVPKVINDSICLNSLANLTATSNAGIIRWYEDSTTLVPVHTGSVFQVGPLKNDTFFFAKAFNGSCTHPGRVKVLAFVDSNFAPEAPTVSNDTTICLLSDPLTLRASSTNNLRWYDVGAGGTVIGTGDTLVFTPQSRGEHRRYVDSYNGNCASSRLPIVVTVNHFPELDDRLVDISGCEGDTLGFDLSYLHGSIDWYDGITGGNTVYSGKSRLFEAISSDESFYLEPYEGLCRDSIRHPFSVESIPFANVTGGQLDSTACDNIVPTLNIQTDVGEVHWLTENLDSTLFIGNNYEIPAVRFDATVYYKLVNQGCVTKPVTHDIKWLLMPGANFDYQVLWRNVEFASRLISQGEYVWNFGDGGDTSMGTDVTHYYALDGSYDASLIVTSPFGCADTVVKEIVLNTVGINDIDNRLVTIYPNPVKSNGIITMSSELSWESFTIYDLLGKEILSGPVQIGINTYNVRLPSLASGQYYIKFLRENKEVFIPFSVKDL